MVDSWSKRVEETESYYKEQIDQNRSEVENIYLERIKVLEQIWEKKVQTKAQELTKRYEMQIKKVQDELTASKVDLERASAELKNMKESSESRLFLERSVSAANRTGKLELFNDTQGQTCVNDTVGCDEEGMEVDEAKAQSSFACQVSWSDEKTDARAQTTMIQWVSVGNEVGKT